MLSYQNEVSHAADAEDSLPSTIEDPVDHIEWPQDSADLGVSVGQNIFIAGNDEKPKRPKYRTPPNPNNKPPPEHRKPSGSRERNIGHKGGEEHGRRPKGNRPIVRPTKPRGPTRVPWMIPAIIWDIAQEACREGELNGLGCLPENRLPSPQDTALFGIFLGFVG